ncbi:hypothetical protein B1218_34600, partial [Pseudomonas ogarae]
MGQRRCEYAGGEGCRGRWRRGKGGGQCHRQQAQGEARRDEKRQRRPEGRVDEQAAPAQEQRRKGGKRVAAGMLAKVLVGALLVERAQDG